MMLKQLPKEEQPRERLLRFGSSQLSNVELLALLIGSGNNRDDAMAIALNLLGKFGNLKNLYHSPIQQLREIRGISIANGSRIKAALELGKRLSREVPTRKRFFQNSRDIFEHYRDTFLDHEQEVFLTAALDSKNGLIGDRISAKGSVDQCPVFPREVFGFLMRNNAVSTLFIHTHPSSGDPTPSGNDIRLTRDLIGMGELLHIRVLDHVIIGAQRYYSMFDNQSVQFNRD